MRTAIAIMMAVTLVVALGCGSPRGGSIASGEGFSIDTPTFTTNVTQGTTESVKVSLNRGKYFKRDVTLDIRAAKGISVEPTQAVIRGSEAPEVHLRIAAAKNADLGEYKIFIKGTPERGESTSTEIQVKVVAP